MFGLFPRKGTIAVGSDADIVVFDPEPIRDARREDAAHERGLQPVRGTHGAGIAVSVVICSGQVVIEGDEFVGRKGAGRFLRRGPSRRRRGCSQCCCAKPSILLVDDDSAARDGFSQLLEIGGIRRGDSEGRRGGAREAQQP